MKEKTLKPLIVLGRIAFVGIIWSIFFIEGIRVMLLVNWHFDIFNGEHWRIAYNLWIGGWTIRHSKEWAFVFIIVSFIPLWLTGWAALSLISWEDILNKFLHPLLNLLRSIIGNVIRQPINIVKSESAPRTVKQKKSYKEVRPRSPRAVITSDLSKSAPAPLAPSNSFKTKPLNTEPINLTPPAPRAVAVTPSSRPSSAAAAPTPQASGGNFDHSLFKFDSDEDDFSFDIDAFDEKKQEPAPSLEPAYSPPKKNPAPKKEPQKERSNKPINPERNTQTKPNAPAKSAQPIKAGGNSVLDVIKQKGYDIITNSIIKDITIDFIGLSSKEIHLFLVDKEPGDWLADEERFNDEEPLWFSESSHRISPVRKIDIVRNFLAAKLKEYDMRYNLKAHVVIALGNIINAEDMTEIWNNMNIEISRIDRGSPKELKLFTKALPDAIDTINKDKLEKIKKLIKNIS